MCQVVTCTVKRSRAGVRRELVGRGRGDIRWLMESCSEGVMFT